MQKQDGGVDQTNPQAGESNVIFIQSLRKNWDQFTIPFSNSFELVFGMNPLVVESEVQLQFRFNGIWGIALGFQFQMAHP